jgi:hypothetical protein
LFVLSTSIYLLRPSSLQGSPQERGVRLLKSPQEKHRNSSFVSFLGTISAFLDPNPQIKINADPRGFVKVELTGYIIVERLKSIKENMQNEYVISE